MTDPNPSVLDAVGGTPVVRLNRVNSRPDVELLAKLEFLNPGGSSKDRSLAAVIEDAERRGELAPGDTIIESTSGNFGVAMAMAGAARGYRVICIVDPKLTDVIEAMLVALGAEIRFADQADETGSYLKHRLRIRDELLQSIPGAWCPGQYTNPKSIEAHATTGREIADALGGRLDYLVIPTGTGATVTGAGRAAKDAIPGLTVVAVDAYGSQIFDSDVFPWKQKGLGSGLRADQLHNLDTSVIDEVRLVADGNAFLAARAMARNEGLLAGGSSGAAVFAALTVVAEAAPGSRVLTLLPDGLERYLFEYGSEEWLLENGFDTTSDLATLHDAVAGWIEGHDEGIGTSGLRVRKVVRSLVTGKPCR